MRTIILGLMFGVSLFAQQAGMSTFSGTQASLPGSCTAGNRYWVTNAAPGSNEYLCSSDGKYYLPAGTGSPGSGIFTVVRTSGTVLTLGAGCSASLPCTANYGTTQCTLTTSATATISATTDTAYMYWDDTCTLSVGTNTQTVTCSGCTAVTGITGFPPTSIPLWTWASTTGVWATGVGTSSGIITQKGADPLGRYYISTADTQLKNAVNLGALTTGLVKISVSGSVATPSTYALPTHSFGATFTGGGSALVSGTTPGVSLNYLAPLPNACTATAWTVTVDAGTAGFRVWRVAAGTAIPTVGNTITTGDLAISSGTNLRSTTMTNFSGSVAPVFAANDVVAIQLNAVATATVATFSIQCQ
jgi:hypothetical protein